MLHLNAAQYLDSSFGMVKYVQVCMQEERTRAKEIAVSDEII
jgi:hypothetical protein